MSKRSAEDGDVYEEMMRKTASQIADEVLKKLSFQGRMGFEASAAGGAPRPAAPAAAPAPAAPKPPMPAAAPMPKVGASIADEILVKLSVSGGKALKVFQETMDRAASTMSGKSPEKTPMRMFAPVYKELMKRAPRTERLAIREAREKLQGKKTASQISTEVLLKLSQGEEQLDEQYYEDTPSKKRHWPYAMGGALAGGAAAHYLAPSAMTKSYRETAKGLQEPAQASLEAHKPSYDPKLDKFTGTLPEEHMTHVRDVSAAGRPVRFNAPAHAAQKYFKSRAWAESMPRTLGGAGLGLGAGLLASSLF